jgi:signal transduction histidine kinase/ligand-binding sensor domain-containing protein/DNA-binding response OmpR family regulator
MPQCKSRYNFIITLFIVAFCTFFVSAYPQTTKENNITIDDGLINNEVTAIHQDKYGFIWFATRGGLNKYDGYEFKTISSAPNSFNSFSNQAVEVIAESNDILWIGNKTGGLSKYDIRTTAIRHYNPPNNIKIQEIRTLLVSHSGDLFIGSLHGLYILRNEHFIAVDNSLTVSALVQDSTGTIWVGSVYGLYKYNTQKNKLDSISIGEKRFEITSLAIDNPSKTIFIGTWGNGFVKYNMADKTYKQYFANPVPGGLTSNNTYRIMIDRNRKIWVGTWGGGLLNFDVASEKFIPVVIKPFNVYNNDYDIILSIMQDNSGILWIGTDGAGICKVDPYRKKFNIINNDEIDKPVLTNTHITAVYEDKNGLLWLGGKNGAISYSQNKKNFTQLATSINPIRINTFFENNNDLWVGTGNGIFIYRNHDYKTNPIQVKKIANDTTSLSGPKVTAIVKDKTGTIWVGTQEHGLNKIIAYNNGIPVFKRYPEKVGVAGALQNDRVSCMLVDKQNRLWVGTYDGLHLYNRDKDNFKVFIHDNKADQSLSSNSILSLTEDGYGNIWAGTQQGLNELTFLDNGKLEIKNFYQCAGFPNDYVHAVLVDNDNNIWMSTNKGITKYNIRTKNFRNFDIRDGVSSNTFSENVAYLQSDGEMYFGSINGVTYFYPDSIFLNHYKPKVYITNLQINNQDVVVGSKIKNHEVISNAIFLTSAIKLNYKENILTISFAALDYHASDKNQYQYKLEGFDENWVDAGNRRTVTYTNLPSGNYVFKVKASNSDQIWNDAPTQLHIGISPPPWKTWWAYLIYFLILSGLLWFSRYITIKRIYLQNSLEIANLNYAKEHEIAEIKSKFFTNISHEFRTPLTLMIGPLQDLANDEQLSSSVKEVIRKIQNQSKRLLSLVNQLLDFHKAETKALKLDAAYHDIIALSKYITASFEEEAKRKQIRFEFQSNKNKLFVLIDKDKIESIIYNLLSNAFKFTPTGGYILFQINYMPTPSPTCEIIVSDTGKGVSAEDKGKIFDRFYQVSQAEPGKYLGTGIGLAFVKDLVELHKGTIQLEDNLPQGSIFKINFPAKTIDPPEDEEDATVESVDDEFNLEEAEEEQNDLPIILVVEDNDELNQYLCKVLSKCGEVIAAKDGKEGLEKAFQTIPDIVVSDIMMPEVDGYTLCKTLKEDNRTSHIPIILLTAKSDDTSHIEGIQLGADSYLSKPFNPAILNSHVKNLIKSRKKLKELFAKRLNIEPTDVEVDSFDETFIKNAISFVEENIEEEEFSIDNLAVKLNMSRSTFYRKLKALTGMSGADFIRTIRLKRSAQLLKTGEYTVSMAAYSSGFNDLKNFRKSFQKQFGVTPSEYMKHRDI